MRFVAIDAGGESIVEAGVDDLELAGEAWFCDDVTLDPLDAPLIVGETGRERSTRRIGIAGRSQIETRIDDVAMQLTPLIEAVRSNGFEVSDMEVQAPSLHHVFLHLTGNALRD